MNPNAEIVLEGTYLYFQKEQNYSQENFKLVHLPGLQQYHMYAEILSRIETGEFLKILVRYEMTQQFIPVFVRVEKSIGSKYALESYKLDTQSFDLKYTFQNTQQTQEFRKGLSSKHYLTSPAVSTAALFTLTKKFDATGRTPLFAMSSENDWTYEGPPTEKIIYCEFKVRELEFELHGNTLLASHLCLYEQDSMHVGTEHPVELFLSKHYNIPYQLSHGDQKIVIKNLKKNA
jgi:hypothetical protein